MEALTRRAAEFLAPFVVIAEIAAVLVYFSTIVLAILLWSRFPIDASLFYLYRKILIVVQFIWVKFELSFSWLMKEPKIEYFWPVALGVIYVCIAYKLIPWAERRRIKNRHSG